MEPRVLKFDDRGAGDPLVLVPGGLTGWVSWVPHQERLVDRHRVVRVQPIHNELGSKGVPGDPDYTAQIERESLRLIERLARGGAATKWYYLATVDRLADLAAPAGCPSISLNAGQTTRRE
jgi:hypothetical protein